VSKWTRTLACSEAVHELDHGGTEPASVKRFLDVRKHPRFWRWQQFLDGFGGALVAELERTGSWSLIPGDVDGAGTTSSWLPSSAAASTICASFSIPGPGRRACCVSE